LEKYQEALDEREYLDRKKGISSSRRDDKREQGRRYVFTDSSRNSSFKRPNQDAGEREDQRSRKRPTKEAPLSSLSSSNRDKITSSSSSSSPQPQRIAAETQPIPSAMAITSTTTAAPALSRDQLNKLNAAVMKARLMGLPNADELETQYNEELERFEKGDSVAVLPTLDSHGRMYDYALKSNEQPLEKGKHKYQGTHDKLTGERIKYGTADDQLSLADMVKQERAHKDSSMDLEFANRIVGDASFEVK
jgi:hypothetical protein